MKIISRLTYYRHGEPTYDIQSWEYDSPSRAISKVAALYERRAMAGSSELDDAISVAPSGDGELPEQISDVLDALKDLYNDNEIISALRNKEL